MCNVLIISAEKLSKEEQKDFQKEKRLEISKIKTNSTIKFIFGGDDKKGKKQTKNYLKKHPRAYVQRI